MQCVVQDNYVRIIFKHYTPGSAPLLLINRTTLHVISYWQTYDTMDYINVRPKADE